MDVLLQPTEQTRSHRKAEVVNELLWVAGPIYVSLSVSQSVPVCSTYVTAVSTYVTDIT